MRSLFIFCIPVLLLAGCRSASIPAGTAKEIAYQLEEEPSVLLVPVCDYGASLALGTPRELFFPYSEIAGLAKEYGGFLGLSNQPSRFLLLTRKGELYSGAAAGNEVRLYRTILNAAMLDVFAAQLRLGEFEITEQDSPFLAPDSPVPEKPLSVAPYDENGDWREPLLFLEQITPADEYVPATPFDRSYARHGIYCAAGESHIKPDYPPGAVLAMTFHPGRPVCLEGEEFADRRELGKILRISLKSGKYALLKLTLPELEDVFELERDGIAPMLRELADAYGSDFLIELPGGIAIWRCARCFAIP